MDGKFLVKLSRKVVDNFTRGIKIEKPKGYDKEFDKKQGAFCTLNTYPNGNLRGCIGIPYPSMKLIDAVIEASKSACRDPRFPPLREDELGKITIELSILSVPKDITSSPDDYEKKIKIGRDGLIIYHPFGSGLLLPQVPVEYNWSVREFLDNLCFKAGLGPECWKDKSSRIYSFQAEIFKEEKPYGKIIKEELRY